MTKKLETIQKNILKVETWINKKNKTTEKKLAIVNKAGYMLNSTLESVLMEDKMQYAELKRAQDNDEKQSIIDNIYSLILVVDDYQRKERELKKLKTSENELIQTLNNMTNEQKQEQENRKKEVELNNYIKKEIENINVLSLEKWLQDYKENYIKACKEHLNGYSLTRALREADQAVIDQKIKIVTRTFKKVGKIVDISFATIGNDGSFNGIVIGENGTANIQTVLAGGYNIQRLHYRVLVH